MGARGDRQIIASQPGPQLTDRADAGVHVLAGQRGFQVSRHLCRADPQSSAAGQVQIARKIDLTAGGLVRVLLAYLVQDVVIELIKGYPAVLVLVRIPGGQSLHQRGGKYRRPVMLVVGELISLDRKSTRL